jgi:hypothetical protein
MRNQDDPLPQTRLARCSTHFAQMRLVNHWCLYESQSRLPNAGFRVPGLASGPEGGDPVASGFDVAIVRNDVIAELYPVITK